MDLDGIGAAFLDPRVSLLAGAVEEHWLAAAMCRAYNRRLANYCRPYPDRLFGVAMSFSLFGYGGLDRGGDLCDQGHFCGRAEVQGGAHLVSEHYFCRFYRRGGAVSCGFHGPYFVHEERGEHFGVVTINTA